MRPCVLFAMALACLCGSVAQAQETMSPAELRRELEEQRSRAEEAERRIERLTEEKAALEQRVARLETRVEALMAEIERLRGGGGQQAAPPGRGGANPGGAPPAGDGEPGGADASNGRVPTNPLGTPSSLYFALQLAYEDAIDDATRPGETLSTEEHREVAERWTRQVRDEISGIAQWLVRLSPAPTPSDPSGEVGRTAMLRVIDPSNMGTIGSPIRVVVPNRYREDVREAGSEQFWDLRVRVRAAPVYNPQRERAGPFNFPLLIGPYAEFGFELEWQSLTRVSEAELAERRGGSPSD